jgi:hypothetical protein
MPRIGHEELKPEGLYVQPHYPTPTDTHSMYSPGKNDRYFALLIWGDQILAHSEVEKELLIIFFFRISYIDLSF